jgi:SAM-dependent methyltransferase
MTAVAGSSERLKAIAGPRLTVVGRCLLRGLPVPRWGNLRRVTPFSSSYGFDRGTPVDRHYLDAFLYANRALITGRVLEVQMPGYTSKFGHGVEESHSVDIDPRFGATYTCDLAEAPQIPSDYYDCFLLPNTLPHLENLRPALRTMLRVTRPGGALLASAAGFLPLITDGEDLWRLSAQGWRRLLADEWPGCEIAVESHGNCLAAIAAMHGLAREELRAEELDADDPRYPVLVTIRCRKAQGPGAR